MKGFIEIHTHDGERHLVNVRHIVKIVKIEEDSDYTVIFTDDIHPKSTLFPTLLCKESYLQIKAMLAEATGTPM